MITGSKGLSPHELAHKWVKDLIIEVISTKKQFNKHIRLQTRRLIRNICQFQYMQEILIKET